MVIGNLNIIGIAFDEKETDPPLVIDTHAVLTGTAALQRFQPVARRHSEISEHLRLVQETQLSERHRLDVGR